MLKNRDLCYLLHHIHVRQHIILVSGTKVFSVTHTHSDRTGSVGIVQLQVNEMC
jgi:hypothetical protein